MTAKNITRRFLDDPNRPPGRIDPDAPEAEDLGPEFWNKARIVRAEPRQTVSLRLDAATLEFYKRAGKGYTSLMGDVLAAYAKAKSDGSR